MNEPVTLTISGSIAIINVNNPPVNALSHSVRRGLVECFAKASQDNRIEAIVLYCSGRTYIAGADITEFGKPMKQPSLPQVISIVDSIEKPIITAIHGTALGGGCEVALTCHYRIADKNARLGLPEVHLGLLPGAGGTQRLPRLVGIEKALDLIVSGRKVKLPEALAIKLIDRVFEGDIVKAGIDFANEIISKKLPIRRISTAAVEQPEAAMEYIEQYRRISTKKHRGLEAPMACISAIEATINLPFNEGMRVERKQFLQCMESTQSAAQQHMFFAQRQAANINDLDKATPVRAINKVAIIGAGTMGIGIALNFSNANIPVMLLELNEEILTNGLDSISQYYQTQVAKGRLSEQKAKQLCSLITGTLSYNELNDVDLVIEAVFESMNVKQQVFSQLDQVCKQGCILASNTSTLDIDEIAAATKRPQEVIGLHFFSPAHVMKLLEVVRGDKTANDVLATAMSLASEINKIGVVSGVCDGFIGNRMLKGYGREAGALLLEGAKPEQIDRVMVDFGMAMGPITMSDLAGLDVGYRVRQERRKRGEFVSNYDGAISDRLVEDGRLGQKSLKGYYRYQENSRTPLPDDHVHKLINQIATELGYEQRVISDEEIVKRLIYPLINEGAQILDEAIAQRASDINTVWVFGYGFPVHKGGPMFYADTIGLENILHDLKQLQIKYGDIWQPAPLLQKMALEGKKFCDL
ncbi:MAG: enoyl-CoA hydratase/isomerase family protein [Kangiellaceae bacterium]|nr:enoyl-CoA hydratase/isomerase family protein [Kangiellaceae bacterium]